MAVVALWVRERPRALRVDRLLGVEDRVEPLGFAEQPVCAADRGLFVVLAVDLQRRLDGTLVSGSEERIREITHLACVVGVANSKRLSTAGRMAFTRHLWDHATRGVFEIDDSCRLSFAALDLRLR